MGSGIFPLKGNNTHANKLRFAIANLREIHGDLEISVYENDQIDNAVTDGACMGIIAAAIDLLEGCVNPKVS